MTLDTYLSYLLAVAFTVMILMVTGLLIHVVYMFFRAVKNERRQQKEDSLKKEILELRSELQRVKQCAGFSFILKALETENTFEAKHIAIRGLREMQ